MKNDEQEFKKMTETPVAKLIMTLSVPTVISMLVTSVYNMADTYFVSKLGTSATGAVGVVFSLMAIIQAVGFTIGMGAGSNISRILGGGDHKKATEIASTALFSGITLGIILTILASIEMPKLMLLFGATDTILPYAIDYGKYIIYGAPVMIGAFVMNNILRSQGKAKYAMAGIASGGILNIVLDPIFIFTLNLGTAGAAIATLISQCISFTILLCMAIFGKTLARVNPKKISKNIWTYLLILKTGLPSLSRQGFASLASMFLNVNAKPYGDAAVASMGVVNKVFMLVFAVLIGIGQGFQPVCGFNYGAKKYDRVKKAFLFTLAMGAIVMVALGVPIFFASDFIMERFTKDDMKVIEIGRIALRMQCLVLPLIPFSTVANMTYQTIGKSWTATLLACARQGLFFIPLVWILPRFFDFFGLQLAQPLADLFASLLCIPFSIAFLKSLKTDSA